MGEEGCPGPTRGNSESLDVRSSLSHVVFLQGIQIKSVHEGHWVKIKVTGPKNVKNAYNCHVKL